MNRDHYILSTIVAIAAGFFAGVIYEERNPKTYIASSFDGNTSIERIPYPPKKKRRFSIEDGKLCVDLIRK